MARDKLETNGKQQGLTSYENSISLSCLVNFKRSLFDKTISIFVTPVYFNLIKNCDSYAIEGNWKYKQKLAYTILTLEVLCEQRLTGLDISTLMRKSVLVPCSETIGTFR